MTLHPDNDELMAWRDEEITDPRAAEIRAHVAGCTDCRGVVESFGTLSRTMARWQVEPPPATFARRRSASSPRRWQRTVFWAAAAVVLVAVAASVRVECAPAPNCDPRSFHFAWSGHSSSTPDAGAQRVAQPAAGDAFERDWMSRRRLPVPSAPGAKVTAVMFIDWQCPACRAAERAYGAVFADFERRMPGAVKVVMKDYPLNMRCNPNVPVEMHPAACEAAVAVRLAREHGTADAMIAWLFANQETLTPEGVAQAAASIGKVTDFNARTAAVLRDVARDVAEGRGLEVGGTPTCFINGVLARNDGGRSLFSPEEIRRAIDVELKR